MTFITDLTLNCVNPNVYSKKYSKGLTTLKV